MNTLETIFKRRSIRKFKPDKVDDKALELLLKAGMAAPTTANNQPWEFVVVTDRDILTFLREKLYFGKYIAPAAIVVCGNMKLAFSPPSTDYWVQDCSAATENILIAATGMGMGTLWVGLYPIQSKLAPVRKILNIPEHVIPLNIIYIGYGDEEKEARTQYNEDVVYWQSYDPERKHRARPKNMKKL